MPKMKTEELKNRRSEKPELKIRKLAVKTGVKAGPDTEDSTGESNNAGCGCGSILVNNTDLG